MRRLFTKSSMVDGFVKSQDLTPSRKGRKVNLLILNDFFLAYLASLRENVVFTNASMVESKKFHVEAARDRKAMRDTPDEHGEPRPAGSSPQQQAEAEEITQDETSPEGSPSPASPPEEAGAPESSTEKDRESGDIPPENELSLYPLREPSEDARWAVRTVWIWIGFGLAALIFIATLLVLGTMYD